MMKQCIVAICVVVGLATIVNGSYVVAQQNATVANSSNSERAQQTCSINNNNFPWSDIHAVPVYVDKQKGTICVVGEVIAEIIKKLVNQNNTLDHEVTNTTAVPIIVEPPTTKRVIHGDIDVTLKKKHVSN